MKILNMYIAYDNTGKNLEVNSKERCTRPLFWNYKKLTKIKDDLNRVIGEGNGNPLQDSCLESPMDGGAW